jgi:23S rRNA pseudouridine955/2504/2580 synthase
LDKKSTYSSVQLITIAENQAGQRLDNFLIKTLKNLPRSRMYRIIRKGEVRVNKKRIKPEYKLKAGDSLRLPPLQLDAQEHETPVIPERLKNLLETSILYEDDHILVLNKPEGLAVHSGSGLRYGVIDVIRLLRNDEIELVHRLDRDTSGCLLLAKNRPALLEMQRMLQNNTMQKHYIALVKGHWNSKIRSVNLLLKKQTMSNGERRVYVDASGQVAETHINKITHYTTQGIEYSLLNIKLLTGRTHQIRVHCQSQHHEIAGDDKYGEREFNKQIKSLGCQRLMLHASRLEIPVNAHTKDLVIVAPDPQEFRNLTKHEAEKVPIDHF